MGKRKTLRGKDVMLWVGTKVIALSTGMKVDLTANTEDGGTKDDGFWNAPEITGMKWSASNESFDSADETVTTDEVYDTLFDMFIKGEPIEVTMGIPTNQNNNGVPEGGWQSPTPSTSKPAYKGKALLTAVGRDAPKSGAVKVSVSLEGVGTLSKVTA